MYKLYRINSDIDDYHVVYTKRNFVKKLDSLIKNARDNMCGDVYEYIRMQPNCLICLQLCDEQGCQPTAESLSKAKEFKKINERVYKNIAIIHYEKQLQKIEKNSENRIKRLELDYKINKLQ